jgi:hypothetical protein
MVPRFNLWNWHTQFKKIRSIEPGMTGAEIVRKIGRPYSVTSIGEKDLWIWIKRNGHFSLWMENGLCVGVPRVPDKV